MFQGLVAGVAEAHLRLLTAEDQLHGGDVFALAPLSTLQDEQEAGRHDAERLEVVDAHHAAGVVPHTAAGEGLIAALFPAVHRGQSHERSSGCQQQAQAEGAIEQPQQGGLLPPSLLFNPAAPVGQGIGGQGHGLDGGLDQSM